MSKDKTIIKIQSLSMPWKTQDPFIFCAYHHDLYPGGNENLGPKASLEGRNIGQDFAGKDGWNMYHGRTVPGFPAHPHSGFETVTIVTKGMVDHSDSLGATGRFGNGDVQWLTSGKGVQHAEMFPLLKEDSNPFEIFQIWLNLPKKSKKADPHYKMLWHEDIPVIKMNDSNGKESKITLVSGSFNGTKALNPTPDSWAADSKNNVQIWNIKMEANAELIIPATTEILNTTLYFHEGESIIIEDNRIESNYLIELNSINELKIINGPKESYFLFLQGKAINEPLVQYGPFVASSRSELQETMLNYQRTQFGGWPWPTHDFVNEKEKGRFSKLPNGEEVYK